MSKNVNVNLSVGRRVVIRFYKRRTKKTSLVNKLVSDYCLMYDLFRLVHVAVRHKLEYTILTKQYIVYPMSLLSHALEPGYNDIGLYGTSSITSDILCYQSIRHS